ncbi:MAG TPA: hypothetical protein VK709_04370 [Candidatus Saccharimonadales bacterium]|nr:hypothetical protein [Candidatus Saccharimonadales bacterium]
MKRKISTPLAAFFFMCLLPCAAAAQNEHQDLKSGKIVISNIVIMPPAATLVKSGMKGQEPLVEEAKSFEGGLSVELMEILSGKGFNVTQGSAAFDSPAENPNLKYALSNLQTRYDQVEILLKKKPKDVRKGRFTLGDEVTNFTPASNADALVFVRANGIVPTAGMKTFVVLSGIGYTRNYAKLGISVVDAQTGTILYFAHPSITGNFVGKPDSMKISIENSLKEFPTPLHAKK